MSEARVIRATFADWATVKTRKVLRLSFEVPLEQQAEVLTMLGAPMPDKETWCAIALLNAAAPPPAAASARSEQGKERYRNAGDMEKALIRAARLPKDARFREWVAKVTDWGSCEESDAASYIRDICCDGQSRKFIGEIQKYYDRFVRMETAYLIAAGVLAEPR